MPEERGHAAAQRGLTLFRPLHLANVVATKLPLCYPTSTCPWRPPCAERRLPTNGRSVRGRWFEPPRALRRRTYDPGNVPPGVIYSIWSGTRSQLHMDLSQFLGSPRSNWQETDLPAGTPMMPDFM